MVTKVGVLGFSDGNGHPYSFSAVLNGYDDDAMRDAGWPVIHDYLACRDPGDFGVGDLRASHVWCPDRDLAANIAAAARIEHVCTSPDEMLGHVDGVIVARDDWPRHAPLARPFLEAGVAVFVDKPLSLDLDELRYFAPHLEAGRLMSCSGLRFARELDAYRVLCRDDPPKHLAGTVVLDWERYGVHLLDAVFSGLPLEVDAVRSTEGRVRSTQLLCRSGLIVDLTCLGSAPKTFSIQFTGESHRARFELEDNFAAFRRLLGHFRDMIAGAGSGVPAQHTIDIMRILIASNRSLESGLPVPLDDVVV